MKQETVQALAVGLLAASFLELGGTLFFVVRGELYGERATEKTLDAIKAMEAAISSSSRGELVDAKELVPNCVGENFMASCTLTNLSNRPVATCIRSRLSQKRASGVELKSQVLCSGRIGPLETKTISGPWIGGAARDICNSTDRFGNEVLDWQACNFTNEAVDPAKP